MSRDERAERPGAGGEPPGPGSGDAGPAHPHALLQSGSQVSVGLDLKQDTQKPLK